MKKWLLAVTTSACFFAKAQNHQRPAGSDAGVSQGSVLSGITLCQTTIPELERLYPALKMVPVEDMDVCPGGLSTDNRFDNGVGFADTALPGVLIQKGPDNEFITKLQFTPGFKGRLPDGFAVGMDTLKLRDVIRHYPQGLQKWGYRPCTKYFSFTHDSISFYVLIDQKQPLLPIDEKFYLDRPVTAIEIISSCSIETHVGDKQTLSAGAGNYPAL